MGEENIILDEERSDYGHDKTEDYQFMPDVVVKQEVSEVLKSQQTFGFCNASCNGLSEGLFRLIKERLSRWSASTKS
ncbi:MAG: hypothetical protein QM734_04980 [Cyclobacteriaceae bacterium]